MGLPSRLIAAVLCGLLVTGCSDSRSDTTAPVTLHVHLDATLVVALNPIGGACDRAETFGLVGGGSPGHRCARASQGAAFAQGPATSLGGGGSFTLGGSGRDAGVALVAVVAVVVAVVAVVLVVIGVWKVGNAVCSPHAATPVPAYALILGGGPEPTQLLHLRNAHSISLDGTLANALAHGGYGRATLQRVGSPAALPVAITIDRSMLCLRPLAADPPR